MRGFVRFSLGGMEGIKRERSEQQSDRAENQHQNGLDLGRFGVEKVRFFIKIALWLYLKICFPLEREAYFQKIHEKSCRKVKNGARIMSDTSKYYQHGVGYMKMASKLCRIYISKVAQGGHL